jgi:hypothetical protein
MSVVYLLYCALTRLIMLNMIHCVRYIKYAYVYFVIYTSQGPLIIVNVPKTEGALHSYSVTSTGICWLFIYVLGVY